MNDFQIGDDPERLTVKLKDENAALKAANEKFRQQVWEILREEIAIALRLRTGKRSKLALATLNRTARRLREAETDRQR